MEELETLKEALDNLDRENARLNIMLNEKNQEIFFLREVILNYSKSHLIATDTKI